MNSRAQTLRVLLQGVGTDIERCRRMVRLLEAQFQAALRHDPAEMSEASQGITELVEHMDETRRSRVAAVRALLGEGGTVQRVIERLDGPQRQALETGWRMLEELVRESKRLNVRNCELLMAQHALMQRVLHGEGETYEPA